MMIACVFSGQGAQIPGMGKDFVQKYKAVQSFYNDAGKYCGVDLLSLTEDDMRSTRLAQLAILTMSLAAWEVFSKEFSQPAEHVFAGFSLGEYSALSASGVLQFDQVLDLVNQRSLLMQAATEKHPGGMYAIIGLQEEKLTALLANKRWQGKVFAANFNAPGQIVISGLEEPVRQCAAYLLEQGAKRAIRLNVNGAFHTPLMQAAAAGLAQYARNFTFSRPEFPIFSNTTGQEVAADVDWPQLLASHMTSPVRWTDEIRAITRKNPACWLEFGPGAVLCSLIKKTAAGSRTYPVRNMDDLQAVLAQMSTTS